MFSKKKSEKNGLKLGYLLAEETGGKSQRVITPPDDFLKIRLTPTNSKFVFYGTRTEILEWMIEHDYVIVEYDPSEFSPPGSPNLLAQSPALDNRRLSIGSNSSIGSTSSATSASSTTPRHSITFDLIAQPIKNSPFLSDDVVFYRPLHFALNNAPCFEVVLEIRPTDPVKDSRHTPIKRLILRSGLSLYEISKALEKCWRNIIPQSLHFLHRPPPSEEGAESFIEVDPENSEYVHEKNPLMDWLATHKTTTFPTPSVLTRWQQKHNVIPPGVLIPYQYDEGDNVIISKPEEVSKQTKQEEYLDKKEKEMRSQMQHSGLPIYEKSHEDRLLEKGEEGIL